MPRLLLLHLGEEPRRRRRAALRSGGMFKRNDELIVRPIGGGIPFRARYVMGDEQVATVERVDGSRLTVSASIISLYEGAGSDQLVRTRPMKLEEGDRVRVLPVGKAAEPFEAVYEEGDGHTAVLRRGDGQVVTAPVAALQLID